MLTNKTSNQPVRAKLLVDMLIDGEQGVAGEIVELKPRDFRYLSHLGRVEAAPVPTKK